MPTALAIPVFVLSVAVMLLAAGSFARRLDRLGLRLGLPEAILGVLTAAAADAPEVTSAVVALVKGQRGVGLGVVVGANTFNLATMIGVSAILAGVVSVHRGPLAIEGFVGLTAALVVTALVVGWMPAWVALVLLTAILVPYLALLLEGERLATTRLRLARRLSAAVEEGRTHPGHTAEVDELVWTTELLIIPVVGLIILGSTGMVEAATTLAHRWSISDAVLGTILLPVLTTLPNAYTAIRLGLANRGSALVSETLNSNTINLVAGIALPALFLALAPLTGLIVFDFAWMIGMTVVAVALLAARRGCTRPRGALLVALYAVFAAVQIARAV
jgi:cation:H+ antiporter